MTGPITRWLHPVICGQLLEIQMAVSNLRMGNIVANCDWLDNCCDGRVGIWHTHGLLASIAAGLIPATGRIQRDPQSEIVALMFVGQHDLNTVLIAFMISFSPLPFQFL